MKIRDGSVSSLFRNDTSTPESCLTLVIIIIIISIIIIIKNVKIIVASAEASRT